jgi:hypothetical protein
MKKGCPVGYIKKGNECVPKYIIIEHSATGDHTASVVLNRRPNSVMDWAGQLPMHVFDVVEINDKGRYVALKYKETHTMGKKDQYPTLKNRMR